MLCASFQQEVSGVQSTHDIVDILVIYRVTGKSGLPDGMYDLLGCGIEGERNHIRRSGHGLSYRDIVKTEHVLDPLLLLLVDGALLAAQIDHHADLFLGHGLLLRLNLQAQQLQHAVGGNGQQPDHGAHYRRYRIYNAAGKAGHLEGLLHGDTLGNQFAEYQGEIGQNDRRQDRSDAVHDPFRNHRQPQAIDTVHNISGKAVRRERTAQEAGQGNGDLDGGQERRRRLHHLQKPLRPLVAFLFHLLQLRRIQGYDRDLRRREERVQSDQDNLQQ